MGKTVAQLLEELGSGELTEWMAFSQLEPFGSLVDDVRAGLGPAMTGNMNRREGAKGYGPLDFFPWHRAPLRPSKPETPEQLALRIKREVFGLKD